MWKVSRDVGNYGREKNKQRSDQEDKCNAFRVRPNDCRSSGNNTECRADNPKQGWKVHGRKLGVHLRRVQSLIIAR